MPRRDDAARRRSGIGATPLQASDADLRINVTRDHLRSLEAEARGLTFRPRQPPRSVLNGRHASRLRGRGLNFEELREYLPGDDVRAIDWKVTARTGRPHVRVYTEERDRPALVVVDQRMSMFFGSVWNMKSVTAAEAAALAAHRILYQGDRIGGIVFGDRHIAELRPQASRPALHRFLTALADANALLSADAPTVTPLHFNRVLQSVARMAPRDHLILVLSDFDRMDDTTRRLVAGISRRNDLVVGLISDPMGGEIPSGLRLVVSDGRLQAEIDTGHDTSRHALADLVRGRLREVLDWERRFGIPVLPLSAAEETLPQLRRLFGLGAG